MITLKSKRIKKHSWKKKKGPGRIIGTILLIFLILIIASLVLIVSACLKPSFMEHLPLFEKLTDFNYAQQVQSEDITENQNKANEETIAWFQTVDRDKVYIMSDDGYKLIAMRFNQPESTENNHKWALVLHGYTGWKEEMYEFAYWYYEQGYNVMVPDLRCQGESEGDFIGMGLTDADDCMEWVNVIVKNDSEAEIVLHGQSMGAATALIMSGREDLPDNVVAIVSDAAYTNAYTMFAEKLKDWFGLPPFPIVDGARLMIRIRAGYDLKKAAPIDYVSKSHTPTLFIHGAEDAMISVDMAKELYEAESAEKELLIIEGAGHAQTQSKDPENYYGTIKAFIEKADSMKHAF